MTTDDAPERPEKAEKPPLNPAHAILVGAVLSAIAGLTATFLNIRSSERLSNEKEKSAAAAEVQAKRQAEFDAKVTDLQNQLNVANNRIEALIANNAPAPTVAAAPLPSIVVMIPQNTAAVPNAIRPEPTTPAVTSAPVSPTVTSSTTTSVPGPTSSTVAPSTIVPGTTRP